MLIVYYFVICSSSPSIVQAAWTDMVKCTINLKQTPGFSVLYTLLIYINRENITIILHTDVKITHPEKTLAKALQDHNIQFIFVQSQYVTEITQDSHWYKKQTSYCFVYFYHECSISNRFIDRSRSRIVRRLFYKTVTNCSRLLAQTILI